jgi:hypothetical protein
MFHWFGWWFAAASCGIGSGMVCWNNTQEIMNKHAQTYNIWVVQAAIDLLQRPGWTINKLRAIREEECRNNIPDQCYYDVILTAIEIMTRPLHMN